MRLPYADIKRNEAAIIPPRFLYSKHLVYRLIHLPSTTWIGFDSRSSALWLPRYLN